VYVALGTFLSLRSDVLVVIADALRRGGVRAAVATGDTPIDALGPVPDDWIVDRWLPQVAMLSAADLAIHHGGNNSVQECLAAGVRQLVLPFSTDQFANAADLTRTGRAAVASPNYLDAGCLARQLSELLATPAPIPVLRRTTDELVDALFA
jgi:UDP:flavonoid glycosyltransferase YjiC (YdhE family)